MTKKEMKNGGRIFNKPVGGAKRHWCNMMLGTSGEVTCEACGTDHPECSSLDETLNLSRFLGLQIVDQCCGRAIDILYQEWGQNFFDAFLEEWQDDPAAWRFVHVLDHIEEALAKVKAKAMRTLEITASNQEEIEKLRVFQKAIDKWVKK